MFFFKSVPTPDLSVVTKCSVLSQIAKLFDSIGWLAPKVIVAKILMQIWKDGIPLCVNFNPQAEVQLHAFCDASEKAYAATLYSRVLTASVEFVTKLLAAKTKVATIKVQTLPRLDSAAQLYWKKWYFGILFSERFTKLLPYNSRFTGLYLKYLHKFSAHADISLIHRLMRQAVWIPKLKNLVKTVVHNCCFAAPNNDIF